jgi:hypothetical protein
MFLESNRVTLLLPILLHPSSPGAVVYSTVPSLTTMKNWLTFVMTWNQHADWLLKRTRRWPRILLSWSMAKSKLYYVIWPRLDGRILTSSFLTVWSLNTILKLHSFWPRLQTVFASCKQLIVTWWTRYGSFVKTKQVASNIQWRKHSDPIKIPPNCCYIYLSYEKQK